MPVWYFPLMLKRIDRLNVFVLFGCMFGTLQRQVAKQNFEVIIGHTEAFYDIPL